MPKLQVLHSFWNLMLKILLKIPLKNPLKIPLKFLSVPVSTSLTTKQVDERGCASKSFPSLV